MEITCPKCSKDTTFNVTEAIKCGHCEHSFHQGKFAKKAALGVFTGLIAGGAIGLNLDKWIEPNRYPIRIEYAVVESCTKGRHMYGYHIAQKEKFAICTCALSKAQKDIDYSAYKKSPASLVSAMGNAIASCD